MTPIIAQSAHNTIGQVYFLKVCFETITWKKLGNILASDVIFTHTLLCFILIGHPPSQSKSILGMKEVDKATFKIHLKSDLN